MFKNSVFKPNVNTVNWLKSAGIRSIKTMAQTFIATIGTSTYLDSVSWKMVLSATVMAGILSIATSVAGIPEVKEGE